MRARTRVKRPSTADARRSVELNCESELHLQVKPHSSSEFSSKSTACHHDNTKVIVEVSLLSRPTKSSHVSERNSARCLRALDHDELKSRELHCSDSTMTAGEIKHQELGNQRLRTSYWCQVFSTCINAKILVSRYRSGTSAPRTRTYTLSNHVPVKPRGRNLPPAFRFTILLYFFQAPSILAGQPAVVPEMVGHTI